MGYTRIPGYRIPGYRIYIYDKPMATRDQVEAWITNLVEPTLSYTRDNSNVTFTLNFTPAPEDIANAVATHKGIQFKVIRHAAVGRLHRNSQCIKNSISLNDKGTRGWNYNNWIGNYFSKTGYLDELVPAVEGLQILTIPALHANITNITATELKNGSITRTLPLFRTAWPNTKGANGGRNQDIYEFFVGLLYWKPYSDVNVCNDTPYKFKMCYYSE